VKFRVGARVRVASRAHDGHHRTPSYLKGKTGSIERVQAEFTNPETRACGTDGLPLQPVYLVGFEQRDVWPGYAGRSSDRIYVDVYEHWLEEAK
jgi:nitrile hydratase subunit beta